MMVRGDRGAVTHNLVQRFRGGLVFKAHRRVYHSTLGLRVIKKAHNMDEGEDAQLAQLVVKRVPEVDSSCRVLIVSLFRGSSS